MISIIIPAHNHKTLKNAINSILIQKIYNIEIIIIDDSMRNNVKKVINKINCSEIKYYKNTNNMGVTLSRIKGIKRANNQYIAFLDDDDLMINDGLGQQLKEIQKSKLDFVFCNYIINNSIDDTITKKHLNHYESDFKTNILHSPGPFLQCCLFRRDFILTHINKFDSAAEPSEDWDFFIELSKHGLAIKHLEILGFQWNLSEESLSSNYQNETRALDHIIKKHYDYMKNHSIKFLSLQYRKLGSMLYYIKQYNLSKKAFINAYTTSPLELKNIIVRLAQACPNIVYHWLMKQYVKKII